MIRPLLQRLLDLTEREKSEIPFFDNDHLYINYFDSTDNWGDTVNLYLLARISGKQPVTIGDQPRQHILGVGSILRYATPNSIVWGSGFISEKGNLKYKPLKVCAVRGPLTRQLLVNKGIDAPEIYGDPALLMPRYYYPQRSKQYRLGVIPHYRDQDHPAVRLLKQQGARIINISQPTESFVDELLECEHIISSSLHGLIASDSYQIPNQWVTFKNELTGGSFKFQDYYHSIGQTTQSPIAASQLATMPLEAIIKQCQLKPVTLDLEALLNAFPEMDNGIA